MIAIDTTTADDAWRAAARLLQSETEIQASRDQPTRELLHVALSVSEPRQRVVFARPFNPAQAIAEVIWILAGANASDYLLAWNPRFGKFLDADKMLFHGAYGERLGSRPNLPRDIVRQLRVDTHRVPPLDQLRMALEAFRHAPDSRQVVLQIWDSGRDLPNPYPRSRDVPCNILSHPMIRNGRLEWLQVMRSNDLFWGTPINFVQFTCLQEIMAGWLGIEPGGYVQISDSLHVYERHWSELDDLQLEREPGLPRNRADLRIETYEEWQAAFQEVVAAAVDLSANQIDPDTAHQIVTRTNALPAAYAEWIALLAAESMRRGGHEAAAIELIGTAGDYWKESWRRWYERKRSTPRRAEIVKTR